MRSPSLCAPTISSTTGSPSWKPSLNGWEQGTFELLRQLVCSGGCPTCSEARSNQLTCQSGDPHTSALSGIALREGRSNLPSIHREMFNPVLLERVFGPRRSFEGFQVDNRLGHRLDLCYG